MSPADDVFEAPPGGFRFGPVHPGRTLADELKARPDRSCLGVEIARPREPHHRDHSGQARHFSRNRAAPGPVLQDRAPFWMALQSQYDLETAERALGAKIAAEVEQAA